KRRILGVQETNFRHGEPKMRNDDGVRAWLRRSLAVVMATIVAARALGAGSPGVSSRDSTVRTLQVSRDNQVVLTADSLRWPVGTAVGGSLTPSAIEVRGVLGRDVVAYAFRVQLVDSLGATVSNSARTRSIDAAVYAGPRLLVQLAGTTAVSLPKPLGFFLAAGDTLRIVALVAPVALADSEYTRLRLIVDCEPGDRPVSRLAVTMVDLSRSSAEWGHATASDRAIASWTWTSEIAGRAMAITGTAVEQAKELSLIDVTTGEVLWRDLRQTDGPGFARTRCARIGAAPIRRDHVYRVSIRYADVAQAGAELRHAPLGAMRVVVLPAQEVSKR
ncbi:MAG TPA: hypothetical protein VKP00_01175, partial [Gemmatimonadaceae bacterium]|nr:hypothetical protein [Gemmatimonadaceae bacterium]